MTQTEPSSLDRPGVLDGYLILTLGLTIFAMAPLLYPGYFQTHTGFVPIWSINRLRETWTDLSWLPVLRPFNPWRSGGLLPYYLAAILPLSSLNALKLVSALGLLAGSSGLYLWLKSWLGSQGATVAALVYTYAPFIVATLYVRGAWSEAFFWGLLPWALLAATYLVARPAPRFIGIGIGFWALLGLSQLGLTLWAGIILLFMLVMFHRRQALFPLLAAGAGFALAALITFPRLNQALEPSAFDFATHLVYPSQLLSAFWGYGLSQPGWNDGLSLSLGIAGLGLAGLTFIIWRGGPDRRPWFFAGLALLTTLVSTLPGGWFWQIPGLTHLLTYPWQLLGFATLGLAVLAGVGFWLEEQLRQPAFFAAVILFILLPLYPNLEPQFTPMEIPADPQAIYGQNEIVLLAYDFFIANPAAEENPDLPTEDLYLPLTAETELKPRDKFFMRVAWQALKPISENYKTFGHLVDHENQLLHQNDLYPQAGARPTNTWMPGEIIEDTYTFILPGGRTYPSQVWLGFYDENTLTRLPALGDDQGRAFLDVR